MARGKPVILDSIKFDTQTQAHAFFQEMLQRYVPGEKVSSEDELHLLGLFERHPNYLEKVGPGVSYFLVIPADFGSQCFCAVLKDGAKEDFSYKKCVNQRAD